MIEEEMTEEEKLKQEECKLHVEGAQKYLHKTIYKLSGILLLFCFTIFFLVKKHQHDQLYNDRLQSSNDTTFNDKCDSLISDAVAANTYLMLGGFNIASGLVFLAYCVNHIYNSSQHLKKAETLHAELYVDEDTQNQTYDENSGTEFVEIELNDMTTPLFPTDNNSSRLSRTTFLSQL